MVLKEYCICHMNKSMNQVSPWTQIIWLLVACTAYHRCPCHSRLFFSLNLQITSRGPGGLPKPPWRGTTREKYGIWVSNYRNSFGFMAADNLQTGSWVEACVCAGQINGRGKDGAHWDGPACRHLQCRAWVREGTSGDVWEAIRHSRNRMETKWERLKLT